VPEGRAPRDPHAPGLRAQGALRQRRLHDAHRAALARRERRRAADALPPRRDAGVPLPLPLAGELGGLLGQPLRAAPRDVGLLPAAPPRASRDDQGRHARLMRRASRLLALLVAGAAFTQNATFTQKTATR